MNKFKRTVSLLMALILIGISGSEMVSVKVKAADSTVKIFIGDSKTPRHHRAVELGTETEELSFSLKGETVKSSSYASNNPTSFKIRNTTEGKCIVEGVAEGSGLVTLTVKTEEGNTYKEKLFISVYTRIGSYRGVANKNTDVYRGATDNAGVENKDDKGDIKKSTEFLVTASCGDFYIIRTLDGTVYDDNQDTGFVKKVDIDIQADSLKINEDSTSVKIGNSVKLSTTIAPEIVANKKVDWSSSNEKVAVVDSNGQVKGKSEGTVAVTAVTKDGSNKKDSIYVSVYTTIRNTEGYLGADSKFYQVANDKIIKGEGHKGDKFTIVGKCGEYYKIQREQLSGDCYVLKKEVKIPVQSINIVNKPIMLEVGDKIKLNISIYPTLANNKNVIWMSSNKRVATVDKTGLVIAKKSGVVTISVMTVDGNKKADCHLEINQKQNTSGKSIVKPIITDMRVLGFNKIQFNFLAPQKCNRFAIYVDGKKKVEVKSEKAMYSCILSLNLEMNRKYSISVKPYLKKGKKKTYYAMSNKLKVVTSKLQIDTCVTRSKSITVKWSKYEDLKEAKRVKGYEIYRTTKKNGRYQLLGIVSNKQFQYVDKNVQNNKVYYYKVRAVGKNEKGIFSGAKKERAYSIKKIAKYIAKNYPSVCTNKKKSMNKYYIYDKGFGHKKYPSVKYRFVNNTLEVHVYLEFVTYIDSGQKDSQGVKIYKKDKASGHDEISTNKYISRFKKGLKKVYSNCKVVGKTGRDFKTGIKFNTKLCIHEKKKGAKYNKEQQFIEVLIGGECPNCTSKGDHWYHSGPNKNSINYIDYKEAHVIYMPTNSQVKANYKNNEPDDYEITSAHEMGHILGLADAYYNKVDRCADNNETGFRYGHKKFDNLMKHHIFYKKLKSNDVEMMLKAYEERVWYVTQYYQKYDNYNISEVIMNKDDEQKEKALW